ncbi:MAG: ROK family protein [Roseiflexaceae bacterium]|nr:ROK family protein [Roseiflexaceae bacterium]
MSDPRSRVEERLAHHSWGALSSQGCILGFDVGSYGLRAALIDLHSHTYICNHHEITTKEPEAMVESVIELGRELLAQQHMPDEHIIRIGVGFSGPVDWREGVVVRSPRMPGWEQYPLAKRLEEAFGAATLVDNDANLIALAEGTFGAGQGVRDLFYLHLSSGVGGGMVLNGRLYQGSTTMAGEIGHAVVGPIDPLRPAGPPATLEERVSIRALLARAAELGLHTTMLSDIFSDEPIGQRVVAEAVDLLAARLSQIVALIDPHTIILGGVVARSGGDRFTNAIQTRMTEYTAALSSRTVPIVPSVLGFESVAIGGVALALESLME